MDNVISSTLLPGVNVSPSEKPLPVVPEDLPQGLKPGDVLMLETIVSTDTFKSGDLFRLMLQTDRGQLPLDVRLQAPLRLDGQPGEVRQFSAKVMSDGTLQLLPVKTPSARPPAQSSAAPLVNNASAAKLPPVTFQPVKLAPVIENLMTELNFPPALKAQVTAVLPQTEVLVALKSLNQSPQLENSVLTPLKNTLSRMLPLASHPQQLAPVIRELAGNIEALGGRTFPAQIAPEQTQGSVTVLDSPLGKIWTEQPLRLPADTALQLEVRQALVPPQTAELPFLKSVAEALARILPAHDFIRIEPQALLQTLRQSDDGVAQLLKIFAPLTEASPQLSAQLLQKIPGLRADVLQNIHSFYRAAESKDTAKWLGTELTSRIVAEAPRGAETIARLDSLVSAAVRETPLWRIIEIPFFDGSQMLPLQLQIKKEPEEEKNKQPAKGGLRFMVNTEFSRLGAFQFDGFSVVSERRFDLVIRTSQLQDKDFCAQIINLFKKSLHDVDYIGTIKINQREAFIRAEPVTGQREGVYV